MGRGKSGTASSSRRYNGGGYSTDTTNPNPGISMAHTTAEGRQGAINAAGNVPFHQRESKDFNLKEKDKPSMMRHFDKEEINIVVNGVSGGYYDKNYSVSVEHRVLKDGSEYYSVAPSGPHVRGALEAAGHSFTKGAHGAHNRSGYLFNSRAAARAAARRALKSAVRDHVK